MNKNRKGGITMGKIEEIKFIEAGKPADYEKAVSEAIKELQSKDLTVEINPTMAAAQKGVGYMYSAVIVGRK